VFSIADLMSAVASHLVGDDLEVLFREPVVKDADGCFYKMASGKRIIEIEPYLDNDQSLLVMLHESAHAILHDEGFVTDDFRKKPSGSIKISVHDASSNEEKEADNLAYKWLAYAKQHQHEHYEDGMSDLEARLWALLDYKVR